MCVCMSLCTTVVHNTAQESADNLPSYPPDRHHWSDVVYGRGLAELNCWKINLFADLAELIPVMV